MDYRDYDDTLNGNDILKFHITYDEQLKLSELSTCVKLLSKGCNKFIRTIPLHFKDERQTETVVIGVENGSFIIDVILPFVGQVSIGLLINYIYDVIKSHFKNKINFDNIDYILNDEYTRNYENNVFSINFKRIDKGFIIDIHINNRNFNWR